MEESASTESAIWFLLARLIEPFLRQSKDLKASFGQTLSLDWISGSYSISTHANIWQCDQEQKDMMRLQTIVQFKLSVWTWICTKFQIRWLQKQSNFASKVIELLQRFASSRHVHTYLHNELLQYHNLESPISPQVLLDPIHGSNDGTMSCNFTICLKV